ncbi:MAG: HlyD family efflux transporter periplasmic adaptor subunit [Burkholderiaceae bacterium]
MMELNDKVSVQGSLDREAVFFALIRPLLLHGKFSIAATEFLSGLAQLLGCERASLGIVDGQVIKICAVSRHYQDIHRPTLSEVTAAMEESILQDTLLTYPSSVSEFPHIVIAHAELVRVNRLSSALTTPLTQEGELIGAITLENSKTVTFDPDQLWIMGRLASDIGPLLYLKWLLAQPVWTRWRIALRASQSGAGRHHRRLIAGAVAGFGALMLFAVPFPCNISGQARLEASVQRVITSPIDGYLKEVHVRPGSRVQARQLLAVLDEETLRVQHRQVDAEILQQENALAEAMSKADRTQVAIRSAKLDEITAQRDLIDNQLSQTQLLAPFDGVVIKGDLTQMLGAPLKRSDTLLTLSQGDGFRVIVEVDERDISDLRTGQSGTLVLAALPSKNFNIRIVRIMPVSNVSSDGQNVFEIEAEVNAARMPTLAPGLKGVAKITTDIQPVGWKWIARAWHALTYVVWSRLG